MIPFPYAELTNVKVRPAVVITETFDKYKDIVVSAISSVVPFQLTKREILLKPDESNNLRVESIIKTDRIVTLKRTDIITKLGELQKKELLLFKKTLQEMVE